MNRRSKRLQNEEPEYSQLETVPKPSKRKKKFSQTLSEVKEGEENISSTEKEQSSSSEDNVPPESDKNLQA